MNGNYGIETGGTSVLRYRGRGPQKEVSGDTQPLLGPTGDPSGRAVSPPRFQNGSDVVVVPVKKETQEERLGRYLTNLGGESVDRYHVVAFVDEFLTIEDEGLRGRVLSEVSGLCKKNRALLSKVEDYLSELNRNNRCVTEVSQQNGGKLGMAMYDCSRPWLNKY